jgi:hypothetical protein
MMPKFTTEGRDVVSSGTLRRSVWRAHHEAWQQSELNQREYCVAQGIPLKAFGNWRARFKAEPQPPSPKLLCLHELGLNPAQRSGVYEYRLEYLNTAMECMNTMARTVDSRG